MVAVTVSDPQQHGEGRDRFTSYRVTSKDDSSPGSSTTTTIAVRRRYSDFRWLYNRLHHDRPGAIVPIIPHHSAMNPSVRFSIEVIQERLTHMNSFLRRVVVHPELHDAPCLDIFLKAERDAFDEAKKTKGDAMGFSSLHGSPSPANGTASGDATGAAAASSPGHYREHSVSFSPLDVSKINATSESSPKGDNKDQSDSSSPTGGGANWISENNDQVTTPTPTSQTTATPPSRNEKIRHMIARSAVRLSVWGGGTELERTPDEPKFDTLEKYVKDLDMRVRKLELKANAIVKGEERMGEGLHSMGLAFQEYLTNASAIHQKKSLKFYKTKKASDDSMIGQIRDATSAVSELSLDLADKESGDFLASVQDLLRTVHAMTMALAKRKEYRLTYTTHVKQVQLRRDYLDNIQRTSEQPGGKSPAANADKVSKAEEKLKIAERAAKLSFDELDVVSKRVLREMAWAKQQVDEDVRLTMMEFGTMQMEHNKKVREEWSRLLKSLREAEPPAKEEGGVTVGEYGEGTPLPKGPPKEAFEKIPPSGSGISAAESSEQDGSIRSIGLESQSSEVSM